MKSKSELPKECIQRAHNNYLALCLIGLNYSDSDLFKKIDNFMENEYFRKAVRGAPCVRHGGYAGMFRYAGGAF